MANSGAVTGASKIKRLEEGLPEDRMTITVAQTWSDKVSSFVRANMYGEYYAVHADWFGTTSDAEWTVDASVSVQVTDNFSLSAGVQNLFDTEALKIETDIQSAKEIYNELLQKLKNVQHDKIHYLNMVQMVQDTLPRMPECAVKIGLQYGSRAIVTEDIAVL